MIIIKLLRRNDAYLTYKADDFSCDSRVRIEKEDSVVIILCEKKFELIHFVFEGGYSVLQVKQLVLCG